MEIYSNIRDAFSSISKVAEAELDCDAFQSNVSSFFDALLENKTNMTLLHHLEKFDNYLYGHCANVCSLTLMLAIKLADNIIHERNFTDFRRSAINLGVGTMLHDIGKLTVPREIVEKPSRLTSEELKEMRRHTVYGFEKLRREVQPSSAAIALHHHLRFDGKGYPERLDQSGKDIHIFSRISTLADVYDAITSVRVYKSALEPEVARSMVDAQIGKHFDPVIVEAFHASWNDFLNIRQLKDNSNQELMTMITSDDIRR